MRKTITLIPGDGIGPEVTHAARRVIDASGIQIRWEICEAGSAVFKRGLSSGVPQETLDSIARNHVALKGPLETPVGYGEKSANVLLRKIFDTYGNIRPVQLFEGVPTPFDGRKIDLVIVRENVEDLYAGVEYYITPTVAQAFKVMSRGGCERIVRLAFDLARAQGRKKVHCATKANILKLTEGLLKKVFEEIASHYPDIESEHIIVDNCAHQLVRFPENFDVIVMSNLHGDILSDLASGLIGGLGLAAGANLGQEVAIFEAVHGSAPSYKGLNKINPTAVILSGVMMLRHIGEFEAAEQIENALALTFKQGYGTADICPTEKTLSTQAFTEAVIGNLGKHAPEPLIPKRLYKTFDLNASLPPPPPPLDHSWRRGGVDVFVKSNYLPQDLGAHLREAVEGSGFRLHFLDNRGFVVDPMPARLPACTDSWRARFLALDETQEVKDEEIFALLNRLSKIAPWGQIESLYFEDGHPVFTKAQGE